MKRMIISGGNGFLGTYLVSKALREGIEVTVVDDMSTSKEINIPNNVKFIREKIENFTTEERYDFIVHLAARPSPEDYIEHPMETILSNSEGTKNMLDIALNSKGIFMYTSSSEVYGEASIIPTPEDYYGYVNPNGIRSCYDESKRFSEALIMAYHRQHGVDARIQRPFNVYGPGIRADGGYGRVIPRFIVKALNGEDIPVHGDGRQTRSFLYVEDWLDATWKFLTQPNLSGQIINIGSSEEISIIELANMIKKMTDSGSRIVFENGRVNDPKRRAADTRKVENIFGWKPRVSLEDGLKRTIEWFRRKRG
ncbi:MAG: NAD-dependent epimerase/dehydratase family protein [Thermoplasmata archaeon]